MPVQPADWPTPLPPISLPGRLVCLEHLSQDHFAELLTFAENTEIWRYLTSRPKTPDLMRAYLDGLLRDYAIGAAMPFVVRRPKPWAANSRSWKNPCTTSGCPI